MLFGSGLVAGEGLVGVGIAMFALFAGQRPAGIGSGWAGPFEGFVPLAVFAFMVWLLHRTTRINT